MEDALPAITVNLLKMFTVGNTDSNV